LAIRKARKRKIMDAAGVFCEDRIMEHLLCEERKMQDSLTVKRQDQDIARRRQSSVRVAHLTVSVKIETPA